jgi:hypothetical protein
MTCSVLSSSVCCLFSALSSSALCRFFAARLAFSSVFSARSLMAVSEGSSVPCLSWTRFQLIHVGTVWRAGSFQQSLLNVTKIGVECALAERPTCSDEFGSGSSGLRYRHGAGSVAARVVPAVSGWEGTGHHRTG